MKRRILLLAFLLLSILCSCSKAQNTFKVSIIADYTYKGNKVTAVESIRKVNLFFEKYNIKFEVSDYISTNLIADDSTLSSSLDNFKNRDPHVHKITMLFTGKHAGRKVGISFIGRFGTDLSCLVVDMDYITNEYVLIHEILHLMGLQHSKDPNNIMFPRSQALGVTPEQEEIIKQYGE